MFGYFECTSVRIFQFSTSFISWKVKLYDLGKINLD